MTTLVVGRWYFNDRAHFGVSSPKGDRTTDPAVTKQSSYPAEGHVNDAEFLDGIRTKRARLLGHDELSAKEWRSVRTLFQAEFALTGVDRDTFDWGIFSQ